MKKIVLAFTILLFFTGLSAQNNVGTPYSKYGFGLMPDNYGSYTGMGGVSAAMRDNLYINFLNPASYTALDSGTFYFQAGYTGEYVKLSTSKNKTTYTVAQNASVNMAFRIYETLFASFGFNERSDIGYDVLYQKRIIGDPYSWFTHLEEGEGGLNELYLGFGFKVKKLSLGVNASYIFGKIEDRRTLGQFSYSGIDNLVQRTILNYYMKTRTQNHINDVIFTFGAQYPFKMKKRSELIVGGTFNFGTYLTGKQVFESYKINYSGMMQMLDNEQLNRGKVLYPMRLTVGTSYDRNKHWGITGDYTFQNMSNYKEFGNNDFDFKDYHKIAIGGYYQPDYQGRNWFKRNNYTAGAYFTRSHIYLKELSINTVGLTLGTQIPFFGMYQKFTLGVALDMGVRGTKGHGLILEQYAKLRINLSFRERWFMKRQIE